MRYSAFVADMQERFPIMEDLGCAEVIATAMYDATRPSTGLKGSFDWDGASYMIETSWLDGCIPGIPCNPATCYTDWVLTRMACAGKV